jgi:hypothetical protein
VSPPYKTAEFDILYDAGISKAGDLVELGIAMKLIEARGGAYHYREIALGRGREAAKRALSGDPALAGEIEKRIRQAAGLPVPAGEIGGGSDRSSGAPATPAMVVAGDSPGLVEMEALDLGEFELEMAGVS